MVLGVLLVLGQARLAFAIDETTRVLLRKLSSDGVAAYQGGDYEHAVEKLEKAWSILQTPPLGLWSGRALEKLGRLVEASERYMAAKRAPIDTGGDREAQEAAKLDAEAAHQAIQARIPTVTVRVEGVEAAALTVTVAGKRILSDFVGLPVPVDPGTIEVTAEFGSGTVERASATVREGEHQEVTLTFQTDAAPGAPPASKAAPSKAEPSAGERRSRGGWQPVVGWIGVGLGSAGLIAGGVTGGIVLAKWSELGCGDGTNPCNATPDETAPVNDLRTVSTVSFIAGGVLAATGITLLITAPKKSREVGVRPYFTFDSVGVEGTF